jgi:hypothetical protein
MRRDAQLSGSVFNAQFTTALWRDCRKYAKSLNLGGTQQEQLVAPYATLAMLLNLRSYLIDLSGNGRYGNFTAGLI